MAALNKEKVCKVLGLDQMTPHQLYHNAPSRFIDARKEGSIHLQGNFSAEELRAMAYWMEHREQFASGEWSS